MLIWPQNTEDSVQRCCEVLGLQPNQRFMLKPREPGESGRAPQLLPSSQVFLTTRLLPH